MWKEAVGVTRRDYIWNEEICQKPGVNNIIHKTGKIKDS